MMSAREYREHADALVAAADGATDYGQILQVEAMAREWRRLAQVAEWQDILTAALAECAIETPSTTPPAP